MQLNKRHGSVACFRKEEEGGTMASIRKEIEIDATAEHAWAAVRDIGAVHTRFAREFVVGTKLDGDSRLVTFANGEVVRERIVDIDDRARRLAYAVVDWRTTHHNASFQVIPNGSERCCLVWITDLLPNNLTELVGSFIEQGSTAIKRTLEARSVGSEGGTEGPGEEDHERRASEHASNGVQTTPPNEQRPRRWTTCIQCGIQEALVGW
jgi:hypothetical protein